VPRKEIDPAYIDAPYYIAPEDKVSQEAFAVIRDAMLDKEVVGIGRVVLARRKRPMIREPYDKGIRGFTLRYASEVRVAAAYFEDIPDIKLPAEMKELAEVIIDRKAAHFDPAKFEDRYENAVIDLLKTKEGGFRRPRRSQRLGHTTLSTLWMPCGEASRRKRRLLPARLKLNQGPPRAPHCDSGARQ
jgi:DNA end-binding protein Ku